MQMTRAIHFSSTNKTEKEFLLQEWILRKVALLEFLPWFLYPSYTRRGCFLDTVDDKKKIQYLSENKCSEKMCMHTLYSMKLSRKEHSYIFLNKMLELKLIRSHNKTLVLLLFARMTILQDQSSLYLKLSWLPEYGVVWGGVAEAEWRVVVILPPHGSLKLGIYH